MRLKRDCKISINTFEKLQVDCCDDLTHADADFYLRIRSSRLNVGILIKRQIIKKKGKTYRLRHWYS